MSTSVLPTPILVMKTLIAPTVTVLTAVLVNKVLTETEKLVKVHNASDQNPENIFAVRYNYKCIRLR